MADVVLKVNFPPFLLLLDLHGPVDDEAASAVFADGSLTLTLSKVTPGPWPELEARGDKATLKQRRAASVQAREEKDRVLAEKRREKRIEDGRTALRKQVC